jgi:hypothetical protein
VKLLPFISVGLLAAASISAAAPSEQIIPLDDGEALIVPADSPAHFRRLGKDHDAHFTGKFVLTGTFSYGCEYDCDGSVKESDLALYVVPDAALVARLPRWKQHTNDIRVFIDNPIAFGRGTVSSEQRAALMNGRLDRVTGHVSIVVDQLQITIECDSAGAVAHFVAFARPATVQPVRLAGNYGC